MASEICKFDDCTGCFACAALCPTQCITMLADSEGFLRPRIDEEKCVDCKKCQMICPVLNAPVEDGREPKTFAARIVDESVRAVSSSGGAFSAFAKLILSEGGVVFGAGFDENMRVIHKVCTSIDTLDEIRRSKYVQSDVNNSYHAAKEFLEAGRKTLFCGTPCQIGGLLACLNKGYENLYTVDFICHGVPSPFVYSKYLDYLTAVYNSEVAEVNFRSKERGWHTHSLYVRFTNGKEHSASVSDDYYMRSFIMDMDLRPSCYRCRFKQPHRLSDVTIADFWGADRLMTEWNDDKGISLILVHSEKGERLLRSVKSDIEVRDVPFCDAIRFNQSMIKPVSKPPLRDSFMRDVNNLPFDKLHRKYCGTNLTSRVRRKLAKLLEITKK